MKTKKILLFAILALFAFSCSEDVMDEINKEQNDALQMSAQSILPDAILKTAFETTGTDIAWYSSVFIEHSAGTWGQSNEQDKRIGQEASSVMNNSWNALYDVLNMLNVILDKTGPEGDEENDFARGVAQILTAYNLAVATDMWGEIPWEEALQGAGNLTPKYDKQSVIYPQIITYLNDGITTLTGATNISGVGDYIYRGSKAKWIAAAQALKARYYLRMTNVDAQAAANALTAISAGAFTNQSDALMFAAYEEGNSSGENPWFQFMNDRSHLSVSTTLFDLMSARNDTLRMDAFFTQIEGAYNPAPNGTAAQSQGGLYSVSKITEEGATAATPLMTYHELKFIEAEAKFRTSDATWNTSLEEAITASFVFHGLSPDDAAVYFANDVTPLLTAGNELNEILTQKYIALYEHEAIEAYNDYRRVPAFLTLNNPFNNTVGFVWRYAYPTSEESSNSGNVPDVNIFADKVWWAGGTEKVD